MGRIELKFGHTWLPVHFVLGAPVIHADRYKAWLVKNDLPTVYGLETYGQYLTSRGHIWRLSQ